MEKAYSGSARVVTIVAGDFDTDPTDARFVSEGTFASLREKFVCAWENILLAERVTNPAKGRYPDACFDGISTPGEPVFSRAADVARQGKTSMEVNVEKQPRCHVGFRPTVSSELRPTET
jgi:hypothetical protein